MFSPPVESCQTYNPHRNVLRAGLHSSNLCEEARHGSADDQYGNVRHGAREKLGEQKGSNRNAEDQQAQPSGIADHPDQHSSDCHQKKGWRGVWNAQTTGWISHRMRRSLPAIRTTVQAKYSAAEHTSRAISSLV